MVYTADSATQQLCLALTLMLNTNPAAALIINTQATRSHSNKYQLTTSSSTNLCRVCLDFPYALVSVYMSDSSIVKLICTHLCL